MKLKITDSKNRSMKERLLKEGPGAGYTITAKGFSDVNITSARVVKADGNGGTIAVDGTCTIDELYAESYYYGTGKMTDIPAAITEVYISEYNLGYDANGDDEDISKMSEEELIVLVKETVEYYRDEIETVYGGGWMHSTYDGSIENRDEPIVLQITDQAAINFIDLAVQGDNYTEEFVVSTTSTRDIDYFDDEYSAIEYANKLAVDPDYIGETITVERRIEYYGFEGESFDMYEPEFDTVYEVENELEWGDDEDTDYQESFRRKRTESAKRRSVNESRLGDLYDIGYAADGIIKSVFTAIQRDWDNTQIDATSITVSSITKDRDTGVVFIDVTLSSRVNPSATKYLGIEANVKDNQFEIYDLDDEKFIGSCNMDESAKKTIDRVIMDEAKKVSRYADTVRESSHTKRRSRRCKKSK